MCWAVVSIERGRSKRNLGSGAALWQASAFVGTDTVRRHCEHGVNQRGKNDELIISVIMTSPRYWAAQKSAKEEFENCAMLRSAQLVERLDFFAA